MMLFKNYIKKKIINLKTQFHSFLKRAGVWTIKIKELRKILKNH